MDLISQLDTEKRKVDYDTFDFSIKELVNMVGEGIINIAPEYQRKFRWDDERQSKFIESIFLGIPIPSLFMATNKDSRWEVIDGVQRISTLVRFMDNVEAKKKIQKPE